MRYLRLVLISTHFFLAILLPAPQGGPHQGSITWRAVLFPRQLLQEQGKPAETFSFNTLPSPPWFPPHKFPDLRSAPRCLHYP